MIVLRISSPHLLFISSTPPLTNTPLLLFRSCEIQVGKTPDIMDQLVEEQSLNPLFAEKNNAMDAARNLSIAKKNEINYVMNTLETASIEL